MKKKTIDERLVKQVVPYRLGKVELRKAEIMRAAIALIAKEGVGALTFEAVGKHSNISKSHVAYHFPSLDDLVGAAIKYVYAVGQEIVVDFIQQEKKPEDRLEAYIRGTFHWMESHPHHAAVTLLCGYLSLVRPEYALLQKELTRMGRERIMALLSSTGKRPSRQLARRSEDVQAFVMGKLLYFIANMREKSLDVVVAETVRGARAML